MATTFYMSPISLIIQYLTNIGALAAGGQVNTYLAGTVSTPQVTYTDNTGLIANANPMTLSSAARPAGSSGANVSFWTPQGVALKVVITDAVGNQLWNQDNISAINDPSAAGGVQTNLANPATGFGADLVANAVKSYSILAALRAANVPSLASGQTLIVITEGGVAIGDGLGGQYYWSATSTAVDDGTNVIKPTAAGATGRYLRLGTGTGAGAPNVQNASYTFQVTDEGGVVLCNAGSPTYTFNGATVAFPVGTSITVLNIGPGAVAIGSINGATVGGYSLLASGGFSLAAGQSVRMYQSSLNFWQPLDLYPINYGQSSWTTTLGGMTATIQGAIAYKIVANRVSLYLTAAAGGTILGTSNTTGLTASAVPAVIQPSVARFCPCMVEDNGVVTGGWCLISGASLTFGLGFANGLFTNVGTKGLPAGWTVSYDL